ncbi:MAG: biopolymer transporter ExbD [Candidatus Omnitrophica bacterium]|nr:biopolymer transporter ExbD [Candidatus Omnitrophota bacterium]
MIRHHRRQRFVSEINITPFTDVILVLLIIFMVAAPVIYQSNIKVKLPKVKSPAKEETGRQMQAVITITTEGMVYLDEKLVTQAELKEKIIALHKDEPGMSVYLRADQQTRFKDVVDVFDLLTELGVSNLDIMAVHTE